MKHLLILAAATLLPSFAMAQDSGKSTLTMDAQIRTRGEYNNGAGKLRSEGNGPATFINDRVRLGIGWERENLSMKISAQHVGVWGDDALKNGTAGKKGEIGINEAWAKLKFGEDNKAFVQLGRQILSYDDERLLGGLDWATCGQSHDAVRFGYQSGNSTLHAIVAYNQASENKATGEYNNIYPSGLAPYQHMEVLWYHHNVSENFGGSFIFMNTGVQTATSPRYTSNLQTTGVYLNGRGGDLTWNGAFYYQFGEAAEDVDVAAFMASLNAKYKINDQWTVGLGDDYLSGNSYDDDADAKYKKFNNLYGTHHKFYGAMDLLNGNTAAGLNDLNANVAYKASPKVDMSTAYHYFAAHGLEEKKSLGSEVDLQLNWKIQKNVTFQCGYSMFFATEAFAPNNTGTWQDWGWVSLNINPQIFKTIF